MLKEIRIYDNTGKIVEKNNDNLIVILVNGKKEFIKKEEAEDNLRLLRGQLTIIGLENDRKTGGEEHKTDNNCKTTCTT